MRTFELRREMVVPRPIEEVFAFFGDPTNLEAITLPWLRFRILELPSGPLEPGSLIRYHYRLDAPFDHAPTVEETADVGHMLIGSIEEVADRIGTIRDRLALRHLLLFLDFPGLDRAAIDEQMALLAEEVLPRLGIELTP